MCVCVFLNVLWLCHGCVSIMELVFHPLQLLVIIIEVPWKLSLLGVRQIAGTFVFVLTRLVRAGKQRI